MDTADCAVIGAGVVGLAVAREIAAGGRSVALLERHSSFGQETSSRNSEVIHSGIYYPPGSLKARLCVAGNPLLYEYCANNGIRHRRTGKLVVATDPSEEGYLRRLKANGEANGVANLELLSGDEARQREPEVKAVAALLVPSTGIVDSHALMLRLLQDAQNRGALVAFNSAVTAITKDGDGLAVTTADGYSFRARRVVNCAGLGSDAVAAAAGIDPAQANYRIHTCKGSYFRSSRKIAAEHLIYPVPDEKTHTLGIHLTMDLAGSCRFGPDTEYAADPSDFSVDDRKRRIFAAAIKRYLPVITQNDLYPDTAGFRPRLQGPVDGFRDFVICRESARGLPGLINLIGIESPGLTSCLAIAQHVARVITE